jgi:CRP-like cAMP-binding protein
VAAGTSLDTMDADRKTRVQRELFLRVLVLSKPAPAVARALAEAITDVRFAEGEVIYRKGDDPIAQWWITSGKVDLLSDEGEEPWHMETGAVIGILDVLLDRPRARTAIARTDVEAMRLSAEDWLEMLEDNPDYLAQLRREVPQEMHDKHLVTLAPDGGFPEPAADDGRAAWMEMTAVDRLVTLRETPAFSRASVQALVEVARFAEVRRLAPGERLFDFGDFDRKVYVVAAGIVHLEGNRTPLISARFGRYQVLGGGSAFCDALAGYRATAEVESIVLVLSHADLDDACEDHFDLARSIARETAVEREQIMNQKGRRLKGRSPSTPPPPTQVQKDAQASALRIAGREASAE